MRFINKPIDEKISSIERFINRNIASRFNFGYQNFGKKSNIIKPIILYGKKYISIGSNTVIRVGARIECIDEWNGKTFEKKPSLIIGNNVKIEQRLHLICANSVIIKHDTTISFDVMIMDCNHDLIPVDRNILSNDLVLSEVEINEFCFIGAGVKIMPGVTLGRNCVVGANSVVTKSFSDYTMIAGIPARAIKVYDKETRQWKSV